MTLVGSVSIMYDQNSNACLEAQFPQELTLAAKIAEPQIYRQAATMHSMTLRTFPSGTSSITLYQDCSSAKRHPNRSTSLHSRHNYQNGCTHHPSRHGPFDRLGGRFTYLTALPSVLMLADHRHTWSRIWRSHYLLTCKRSKEE